MEHAMLLAGLIGPILMVLSISEALNLSIWKGVDASVVYLNGLLLFVAGLSIVRTYNHWAFDWTVMITLIGWLSLLTGVYRLFFPNSPQLRKSAMTYALLLVLFLTGSMLSYKAYVD
jgi:hypothetical protein